MLHDKRFSVRQCTRDAQDARQIFAKVQHRLAGRRPQAHRLPDAVQAHGGAGRVHARFGQSSACRDAGIPVPARAGEVPYLPVIDGGGDQRSGARPPARHVGRCDNRYPRAAGAVRKIQLRRQQVSVAPDAPAGCFRFVDTVAPPVPAVPQPDRQQIVLPRTQQGADRIGEHADVGVVIVTARRQVVFPHPHAVQVCPEHSKSGNLQHCPGADAFRPEGRIQDDRSARTAFLRHDPQGCFGCLSCLAHGIRLLSRTAFRRYFPVLPPGGQFMPVLCAGSEKYHIFRGTNPSAFRL